MDRPLYCTKYDLRNPPPFYTLLQSPFLRIRPHLAFPFPWSVEGGKALWIFGRREGKEGGIQRKKGERGIRGRCGKRRKREKRARNEKKLRAKEGKRKGSFSLFNILSPISRQKYIWIKKLLLKSTLTKSLFLSDFLWKTLKYWNCGSGKFLFSSASFFSEAFFSLALNPFLSAITFPSFSPTSNPPLLPPLPLSSPLFSRPLSLAIAWEVRRRILSRGYSRERLLLPFAFLPSLRTAARYSTTLILNCVFYRYLCPIRYPRWAMCFRAHDCWIPPQMETKCNLGWERQGGRGGGGEGPEVTDGGKGEEEREKEEEEAVSER